MKKTPQTAPKRGRPRKTTAKKAATPPTQVDKHPRCSRCGSRTVNLEQLDQELLVTLSIHCLICGHYSFIGRPVIRLLKRPNVTIPESIKRSAIDQPQTAQKKVFSPHFVFWSTKIPSVCLKGKYLALSALASIDGRLRHFRIFEDRSMRGPEPTLVTVKDQSVLFPTHEPSLESFAL